MEDPAVRTGGIDQAARHALGWLVFGNAVGFFLAVLLVRPDWQTGNWTYGHWVPLHLNSQLYGWTALPLVGWLLRLYETNESRHRAWAPACVWAWTAALAVSCFQWLAGESSGKIFLDWRRASLWEFTAALILLWTVLLVSYRDRSSGWSKTRRWSLSAGLVGLAIVPVTLLIAASPDTYPPVDKTTGGPTGSSLLGSTLMVIGLMLMLPRVSGCERKPKSIRGVWWFFGFSWLAFAITESIGGTHFDSWQIGAMLLLLPWAWIIPRDWSAFRWPAGSAPWRISMIFWWAMLVILGVTMYVPGILDRIKFTQGLVAHSHLAMAGFTTSFCATLLIVLTRRAIGGPRSVFIWNLAVTGMIGVLAWMGWREGHDAGWMMVPTPWRETGLIVRAAIGAMILAISLKWWLQFSKS